MSFLSRTISFQYHDHRIVKEVDSLSLDNPRVEEVPTSPSSGVLVPMNLEVLRELEYIKITYDKDLIVYNS